MRYFVRPVTLLAVLLIAGGLYVLVRDVSYSTQSQVMKIGDFEARVEERRTIPPWVGIVAIVGGLALLVSGYRNTAHDADAVGRPATR